MLVWPFASRLDNLDVRVHGQVGLHLTQLGKRVAHNNLLSSGKSQPSHLLTPAVSIPNASGVITILAVDHEKHVGFKVLKPDQRQDFGHGAFATAGQSPNQNEFALTIRAPLKRFWSGKKGVFSRDVRVSDWQRTDLTVDIWTLISKLKVSSKVPVLIFLGCRNGRSYLFLAVHPAHSWQIA